MAPTDPCATNFAGAAQLLRIERHVWAGNAVEPYIEAVFGLTSRAAAAASPAQLLAAVREHWAAIENGQHHRRDRSYRRGPKPGARLQRDALLCAALRALAIFLCGQHKRAQRRPQDYHLPDFLRAARATLTTTIRWFTHSYRPP